MAKKHVGEDIVVGGKTKSPIPIDAKKLLPIIGVIVLVLAVLYAIPVTRPVLNRFVGISKAQVTGPCSSDTKLLDSYSKTVMSKGVGELTAIGAQVRSIKDYSSDPSCVYISMVTYYGADTPKDALREYRQLQQLKAEGKSPAERISDGIDMKLLYEGIKSADQKSEQQDAQG